MTPLYYAFPDDGEPGVFVRYDCVRPADVDRPVETFDHLIVEVERPPWPVPEDTWVALVPGPTPARLYTDADLLAGGAGQPLSIAVQPLSPAEQRRLVQRFSF